MYTEVFPFNYKSIHKIQCKLTRITCNLYEDNGMNIFISILINKW